MISLNEAALPLLLALCAFVILIKPRQSTDSFQNGVKEGASTAFRLLPGLILFVPAVRMFSASGALPYLCHKLTPFMTAVGIPPDLLPVLLIRPFSGSAANAVIHDLFAAVGPDSFTGFAASILMGASDTVVYTLTAYFGACGVKKTRYAYPAAFAVLLFCVILSVFLTRLFYPD